jgi:hypothetical protein
MADALERLESRVANERDASSFTGMEAITIE